MRHDAIIDVYSKVVGRIARAPLRYERQIPRAVVYRSRLGIGYGPSAQDKTDDADRLSQDQSGREPDGSFCCSSQFDTPFDRPTFES